MLTTLLIPLAMFLEFIFLQTLQNFQAKVRSVSALQNFEFSTNTSPLLSLWERFVFGFFFYCSQDSLSLISVLIEPRIILLNLLYGHPFLIDKKYRSIFDYGGFFCKSLTLPSFRLGIQIVKVVCS